MISFEKIKDKKRDITVFLILIFIALVTFILFNIFYKKDGGYVRIEIDGKEYMTVKLSEDRVIELDENTVRIENNTVYMEDAKCPDKLCMKMGRKKKAGESIICLPNRVVVLILPFNDEGYEYDSISQ